MTLDLWLLYLLAAVGLSLTPGPNGLLSSTHGACFGLRATVWTVLGGAVGFFLLIAVSLAGIGTLLAASERAFTVARGRRPSAGPGLLRLRLAMTEGSIGFQQAERRYTS